MIGGLQGDFGDLDNKYLKQNISKYPKMSVANIRELQENTAALCKMAAFPSGQTLSDDPDTSVRKVETPPLPSGVRIPDVNIRVESARQPGVNGSSRGVNWRRASECKMAVAGCKLVAAGWNSYSDMSPRWPPMVYPDNLSGYTPCMDSKELSSILDSFGDKKAIKTPKLNTI